MNKQLLKQVREYFQNRHEEVVRYLSNENDVESHEADVKLLLECEPYFLDEIAKIKAQQYLDKQEAEYQARVNDEVSPVEHMLEYLKEDLMLNKEELSRVQNIGANTKKQIRSKNKKLSKVNARIEEIEKSIEKIEELIKEMQPEKRKVGRPKKNKENTANEEEKQEES